MTSVAQLFDNYTIRKCCLIIISRRCISRYIYIYGKCIIFFMMLLEACTSSSGANSTTSVDREIQEKSDSVISDDERKKRPRTAFTAAQIKSLEAEFERNKYLSVTKRLQLSKSLKLTETQVRITSLLCSETMREQKSFVCRRSFFVNERNCIIIFRNNEKNWN